MASLTRPAEEAQQSGEGGKSSGTTTSGAAATGGPGSPRKTSKAKPKKSLTRLANSKVNQKKWKAVIAWKGDDNQ